MYTFSLIGSFAAQAVRMYSGCNNFLRFSRIFMVSTHFVLYNLSVGEDTVGTLATV